MPMHEVETASDEALLRRARAGDRAAFVAFATRWWPRIARFAWSMLGNASQAVAVTEEVIGTVLESKQMSALPARRFMYRLALWLSVARRRSNRAAVVRTPVLEGLEDIVWTDRAAFLLRDVEQLPLEETAAVLESSPADVGAGIHRARIALGHVFAPDRVRLKSAV